MASLVHQRTTMQHFALILLLSLRLCIAITYYDPYYQSDIVFTLDALPETNLPIYPGLKLILLVLKLDQTR